MGNDDFYEPYDDFMKRPLDWDEREVEPIGEMATVFISEKPQLRILTNPDPDPDRIGDPYFKVFDTSNLKRSESKVIRLAFLEPKIIYHKDKYKDWNISNKDIKNIKNVLQSQHDDHPEYTIWQMAKWLWNHEYFGIVNTKRDAYMNGELDLEYGDHPSYVPSDTPIPETWK